MIKNNKKYIDFENSFIANEKVNIEDNFKILNGMYTEAKILGCFQQETLFDLETEIKISKVINCVPISDKKVS